MITNIPAIFLLTVSPSFEAVREDAPTSTMARGLARLGRLVAHMLAVSGRINAQYYGLAQLERKDQVLAA